NDIEESTQSKNYKEDIVKPLNCDGDDSEFYSSLDIEDQSQIPFVIRKDREKWFHVSTI
ncbi:MAG: hypothetical protein MHPSP_004608, partial [Paramarteilia canceri]